MRKSSLHTRRIFAFVATLLVAAQLAACGTVTSSAQSSSQSQSNTIQTPTNTSPSDSYGINKEYLQIYFDIDAETTWDQQTFSAALEAVAGEDAVAIEQEYNALSVIKAAVLSSAYDELVKSYPPNKVNARLENYGITPTTDTDANAYLACGLDAKLFSPDMAKIAVASENFSREDTAALLMSVAEARGNTRNFLGYSDDPEMDSRLEHMWNSFEIFDEPILAEIGRTAVEQKITTGYNLKNNNYDARFLPSLTLQYGHSDIKHAHQLVVLLNSEDIVAKVQLEPKVSVFQYLLEWGPIPEPIPTYEVKQFSDDLYLVFAVEYDLQLEFKTLQDMQRFDKIIKEYAKKNKGNEEGVGLIYASWWQPLYSTTRNDMPADDYYKIYDCVIKNDNYSIHPFCLEEDFTETEQKLNALNASYQVEAVVRYCNKAFHNYMTGEDFQ